MAAGAFPLHCLRRVHSSHILSAVLAQQSPTLQAGQQQGGAGLLQALSASTAASEVLMLSFRCWTPDAAPIVAGDTTLLAEQYAHQHGCTSHL